MSFSYGAPLPIKLPNYSRSEGGVGISFYSDEAGYLKTNYLKSDFAYRIKLNKATMGFGVNVGVMQKIIDINGLVYKNAFDPKIPNTVSPSKYNVNLGVGLVYSNPNLSNLGIGYAMQNGSGKAFNFAGIQAVAPGLHQYLHATIDIALSRLGMILTPYALMQTGHQKTIWQDSNKLDRLSLANPVYTMGALLDVSPIFQLGIGSRFSSKNWESIHTSIGVLLNQKVRLAYAFDVNTSSLLNYNNNTHEIILKYCFQLVKQQYFNDPRNLDRDDTEKAESI